MRNVLESSRRERQRHRVPPAWFDHVYAQDPDPWHATTSPHAREKHRTTIRALAGRRYASGFEAGCSIGVLTMDLSASCDQLLGVDASSIALVHARARTQALPNVSLRRAVLPEEWPAGPYDLVVLSEIGYYFDPAMLTEVLDCATASLWPGGDLLAVHLTGPSATPMSGDDVHGMLHARRELTLRVGMRHPTYQLDVMTRR